MTGGKQWKIAGFVYESEKLPSQLETEVDQALPSTKQESEEEHTRWTTTLYRIFTVTAELNRQTSTVYFAVETSTAVKRGVETGFAVVPLIIGAAFILQNELIAGLGALLYLSFPVWIAIVLPYSLFREIDTILESRFDSYIMLCLTAFVILFGTYAGLSFSLSPFLTTVLTGVIVGMLIFSYLSYNPLTIVDSSEPLHFIFLLHSLSLIILPTAFLVGFLTLSFDPAVVEGVQHRIVPKITANTSGTVLLQTGLTILLLLPPIIHPKHIWTVIPAVILYSAFTLSSAATAYTVYTAPIAAVLLVIIASRSVVYNASHFTQTLQQRPPTEFNAASTKIGVLFVYTVINVIVVATISLASLAVIEHLTSVTLLDIVPVLHSSLTTNTQILTALFSTWPVLSGSTYTTLFFLSLLSPMIVFAAAWVYTGVATAIANIRMLSKTQPAQYSSDAVPDTIQIRRLPNGGAAVFPMFWLLGRRQAIVVADTLFNELSDDELDAVLAHEVYHVQNRDLTVNMVATVLSVLFGGKNAVLVFYNYPEVEREADRYAAETVGAQPLISALRTTDLLWKRTVHGGGEPLHQAYPSFTAAASERGNGLKQDVKAVYDLLFGSVLLDAAHADVEERIARIQAMAG